MEVLMWLGTVILGAAIGALCSVYYSTIEKKPK